MKNKELYTEDEFLLFDQIEKGEYVSLSKDEFEKEKALLQQAAVHTIEKRKKKKSYNIRLFENDVETIKALALKEGLSYQTFISSMVHKIATGQLKAV
jgi:predicted DNA binding CopG/RHH family protein